MNEKELVQKLISNDSTAYKELIKQYQSTVIATCYHFLKNHEDAEDLAQDIFIEIINSIKKFRSESKLSTWIYRISINRSLNRIRQIKRQGFISSINPFSSDRTTLKAETTPEQNLGEKEMEEALEKSLSKLSDNQRIAFTLNRFDELSYKEIAEIMEISLSSVESLIYRAKEKLKILMKDFFSN